MSKVRRTISIYWLYPHLKFWMGGTKFLLDVGSRVNRTQTSEITFITNTGNQQFVNRFIASGVPVVATSLLCTNDMVYWLFFPVFLLWDLGATLYIILKNKPNVLMATLFPSNLIGAIISRIIGNKYIFFCYEPYPFFHDKHYINNQPVPRKYILKVLSLLYGWLDKWASRQAKKIITVDEHKASLIKRYYGIDPSISGVGVDTDKFNQDLHQNPYIKEFAGRPIVVHSTDYTPMKGTEVAIRAMAQVVRQVPTAVMLVSSTQPNSPNKEKYQQLAATFGISNHVIHLGLISETNLPKLYSSGVCYLSTSNDKMTAGNWPVKEALACQTPALRSSIATLDVIDGVSGYIVEPDQSDKIAEKIVYLIKHPELRKKMGSSGRQTIIQNYNWDMVVNKIIQEIS